jgi:hypothetical protein
MTCPEYYTSPERYTDFWCVEIADTDEADQVKNYLRRATSTINMARQAQGACDCVLSTASTQYLEDLSIVLAVVYHKCPCARPSLTQAETQMYLDQVSNELRMIRTGEMELCAGHTGSDFPAIGWAEQSLTDFATANIIVNAARR